MGIPYISEKGHPNLIRINRAEATEKYRTKHGIGQYMLMKASILDN